MSIRSTLQPTGSPVIDCILDTLKLKKQALVFVNTKKSAEKEAEDIAKKLPSQAELEQLSQDILDALPKPTEQCERLAKCVKKGIAFHHAGLHSDQRNAVEEGFRAGTIKVICCTPTLAAGLDLPAFRAIIRDLKRFSGQGLSWIPVLEYLQMAGRAGRPKYDSFGEAIILVSTETEKQHVFEKYVQGIPEPIYSKLAVEPVLRTYLLSLLATQVIGTEESILGFFGKTFWAHQFGDMKQLHAIIQTQLDKLMTWKFVVENKQVYKATPLGARVAQLYLDPLTAHEFVQAIERGTAPKPFGLLHLIANSLEMRPRLHVKQKEYELVQERLTKEASSLLQNEPSMFESEYEDWLNATKTALMLEAWTQEKEDQYLLDTFGVRPGETRAKIDIADWLLYCFGEIAKLEQEFDVLTPVQRLRLRLQYGVHEELLPLISLKGVGRMRARKLFHNGLKTIVELKPAALATLSQLLGYQTALKIKKQLGETIPEEPALKRRKGQLGLARFQDN